MHVWGGGGVGGLGYVTARVDNGPFVRVCSAGLVGGVLGGLGLGCSLVTVIVVKGLSEPVVRVRSVGLL